MALNSVRFVLVVACLLASYTQAQKGCTNGKKAPITIEDDVSDRCANCICQAASGCDLTPRCNGDVCGPFRITWNYWSDAGKPTVNDEPDNVSGAFERCANDLSCAKRALRGYMKKYPKDCDGSREVNCDDWVRIHRWGPWGCSRPLPLDYNNVYEKCKKASYP